MPDLIITFFYRVGDFYYTQVSSRVNPRQKWLTKKIPRTWCDKVALIPTVLYACIINFAEKDGEDAFDSIVWDDRVEREEAYKKLKEVYIWAKTGRAEFQEKINNAYPNLSDNFEDWFKIDESGEDKLVVNSIYQRSGKTYEELYGEVNRLEGEFNKLDKIYMSNIIEYLDYLWA